MRITSELLEILSEVIGERNTAYSKDDVLFFFNTSLNSKDSNVRTQAVRFLVNYAPSFPDLIQSITSNVFQKNFQESVISELKRSSRISQKAFEGQKTNNFSSIHEMQKPSLN